MRFISRWCWDKKFTLSSIVLNFIVTAFNVVAAHNQYLQGRWVWFWIDCLLVGVNWFVAMRTAMWLEFMMHNDRREQDFLKAHNQAMWKSGQTDQICKSWDELGKWYDQNNPK